MFKSLVLLASLVGAAAFQGAAPARSSTRLSLSMDFSSELGAQAPLGFWDPLNLLKDAEEERFERLRQVETKHGRISMLAILGHLTTTSGVHLPGEVAFGTKFADIDNGLAGLFGEHALPQQGLCQLILFIGACDLGFTVEGTESSGQQKAIEFSNAQMDKLGWSESERERRAAVELNNGRAAQMGILALMVHEKLNNDPYIINSLLGFPVAFNQ